LKPANFTGWSAGRRGGRHDRPSLLRQAVARQPDCAPYHVNLGVALSGWAGGRRLPRMPRALCLAPTS